MFFDELNLESRLGSTLAFFFLGLVKRKSAGADLHDRDVNPRPKTSFPIFLFSSTMCLNCEWRGKNIFKFNYFWYEGLKY